MVRSRMVPFLIIGAILTGSTTGQELAEPTKQETRKIAQTQNLLNHLISTQSLRKEMPLGDFLDLVRKQLPPENKGAITVDAKAFGEKALATPIVWSLRQDSVSIGMALGIAFSQAGVKWDYRIDGTRITLTTPDRAGFTDVYDLRNPISKPDVLGLTDAEFRLADDTKRASLLLKRVMTELALPKPVGPEVIEIRNGTQLLLHTSGLRHAEYVQALRAFERIGDVAVAVQCKLYEVDDAFHAKLKNAKRLSLEELERRFFEGKQDETLFQMLGKQKPIQTGAEPLIDNGATAVLLARQNVHRCLPAPAQVGKGDKTVQTFLTGISFRGQVSVSSYRRSLRLRLTENAIELETIQRTKVITERGLRVVEDPERGKQHVLPPTEVPADEPILKENTQTSTLDIPDGGSLLIAVAHRPRELAEKKRSLVLMITARIVMQEEERALLAVDMEHAIPALLADILTNPSLKTTRDYCGTPGDKRFALIDSDTWRWLRDSRPKIDGFEYSTASAKGNRLLGIRIDQQERTNDGLSLKVTLVNAGGSDNGAAPGGCTLRYTARDSGKKWNVLLGTP